MFIDDRQYCSGKLHFEPITLRNLRINIDETLRDIMSVGEGSVVTFEIKPKLDV